MSVIKEGISMMKIGDIIKLANEILKKAWFPGREELKFFEELEGKQKRIWPDSADVGVLMNEDKDLAEARTHIKELLDTYKSKITKGPGKDTTTEMFIAFEQEAPWYLGETLRIYYHDGGKNKTNPNAPGYDPRYLDIETKRDRQKESGYKDDRKASTTNLPF
jgi:hypothetical protein